MRTNLQNGFIIFCFLLASIAFFSGCKGALSPEQTPQRTVINFMKEAGRGNLSAASEWVAAESEGEMEHWRSLLIFPRYSTPPSAEEASKIDKFIELFYRTNVLEETETEAKVSLVFFPTDAMIGYPDVAEDPTIPTRASFTVMLKKTGAPSENSNQPVGPLWEITSLE
ncbi:MAG: hypothetical protein NTY09_10900 [bacterium]|nr:hypothetical protein [bacterium]